MAESLAVSSKTVKPVEMHWHHHGSADVGKAAWQYHPDTWGNYHPRAFVEANSHGVYQYPGGAYADGGGSPDNPLNNPFMFMTAHYTNRFSQVDDIIRKFEGRWGQTYGILPWNVSPIGPLQFISTCDHDYRPSPGSGDWAQSC
jgi:hypothetical protein